MFWFKKNRNYNFNLIIEAQENYLLVLTNLKRILMSSGNNAQADIIHKLIELCNQRNLPDFVKVINGVEMWGGSGAVWEVYIEDKNLSKEFEREILNLINLMEKTKIIGKGIKPIKVYFEDNLK